MPRASRRKLHILYKTTCLTTGRYYIGRHSTDRRNDRYLGSGKILGRSREKYGDENHKREIIAEYSSRELLIEAEEVEISKYLGDPMCMNLVPGGSGDWTAHNQSIEGRPARRRGAIAANKTFAKRKRSSEMMSGLAKALHEAGKIHAPDWTGRKHRPETKEKIGLANSLRQLGDLNSQFGTRWVNKDGEFKKIKKEDFTLHIGLGWKAGRK